MRQGKNVIKNLSQYAWPGWQLDNMLPVGFKYTSSESINPWSIRSFLVSIILLIIIITANITIINMIKITTRSISPAASLWWSLGSASSSTQRSNQTYWSNDKYFNNQIVFINFWHRHFSWQVIPGRMSLLVILFLVIINVFNNVRSQVAPFWLLCW